MDDRIDPVKLAAWLSAHHPRLGDGPVALTVLTGGSSSAVYRLTRGGPTDAVLRLTLNPPRSDSLKAMAREARALQALASTDVPHPRLLGHSLDPQVIGAPFSLLEFIDGWLGTSDAPAPFDQTGPERSRLAYAMIEAIAKLGQIDPYAVGLGGFGRPEAFLERQVDRWLAHMESYKVTENHPGREIPGLAFVADWLRANTPSMQKVSLIHSDVSFANIMFASDRPARVAAIIDWEIATLGDPLLDLGRCLYSMPSRRGGPGNDGKNWMSDFSDMPCREDLAEHYAELTGLNIDHLNYYIVLSMFKLACIIEFNYARMVNGLDPTGLSARISNYILDLMLQAKSIAEAD